MAGGGILMNLLTPRTARGEATGQNSILFALVRDEESPLDETIVVTHERRPPLYYTNDTHTLLWKFAAPTIAYDDTPPFSTAYGGSAIMPPSSGNQTSSSPSRSTPIAYTIQPGDTLSTIAERFGVSVETILWENNLRVTALLRIGQQLTILPTSGVSHRVVRGETVQSIARRYGVTIEDIQKQNGLTRNQSLAIGTRLTIPGARQFRVATPQRPLSPLRTLRDTIAPQIQSPTIGRLFWPTTSRKLNQYFTWRHTGIDIDGDYTSPVYAADDGIVSVSGWGVGYGIHIDIDHGKGLKTRYGHNSKNFVRVGERVKRGQLIGMIGSTGRSTGPHIHFEVIVNGRRVNPLNYTR
ncbi:MAG: M23 family metallopeptidase [Candidatus Magasanikbacteria bacterium]|nr:M23 family metallopeptidase [Candidatus Magasanikbacteria bacterium]